MTETWPKVRLGDVLRRSEEVVTPDALTEYKEITVRLWGKGVVERGRVSGADVNGRRFLARKGQFIASRIDARNGAMGIVPETLDGALVTNDFPLLNVKGDRLLVEFLGWLCKTPGFVELCMRASEGTTNRVRLKENRFLALEMALPPLSEQRRIVGRIEALAAEIDAARRFRGEQEKDIQQALVGAFWQIARGCPRQRMRDVAPLVRRAVNVDVSEAYPELGIRSFGNGTFQKPSLTGFELGGKRIFKIEPGDLLFSNVFAWEGAIAVARPEDAGRFGSHRFITCVAKPGSVTAPFLCFYFLTEEGLELIRAASPGGAGRNRTLGIEALADIDVPVPPYRDQCWFDDLQKEVVALRAAQRDSATEVDALLPSILDRAFKGEL